MVLPPPPPPRPTHPPAPPPPPLKRLGRNFALAPLAQLFHVVACFVLCTALLVLPLLPPFVGCILGTTIVDFSNRKRVMDSLKEWRQYLRLPRNELRKVAKVAVFLPLEIFEKGLEPLL